MAVDSWPARGRGFKDKSGARIARIYVPTTERQVKKRGEGMENSLIKWRAGGGRSKTQKIARFPRLRRQRHYCCPGLAVLCYLVKPRSWRDQLEMPGNSSPPIEATHLPSWVRYAMRHKPPQSTKTLRPTGGKCGGGSGSVFSCGLFSSMTHIATNWFKCKSMNDPGFLRRLLKPSSAMGGRI